MQKFRESNLFSNKLNHTAVNAFTDYFSSDGNYRNLSHVLQFIGKNFEKETTKEITKELL